MCTQSMELIVPFLSFMFFKHHHTENGSDGADEEHKSAKGTSSKSEIPWTSTFKIVPIMVGSCKQKEHALYGQILARYFGDESTLFVISSDFCHWGNNYNYTPFDEEQYASGHIHQYIKDLDFMAMALIQKMDYHGFYQYLGRTQNTICGQHPICVLLNIVHALSKGKGSMGGTEWAMKFVDYSQSSKVTTLDDFSVSYASGVLYEVKKGTVDKKGKQDTVEEDGSDEE